MTLLNRSTFLICNNPILVNVYENHPFIASLGYKIHKVFFWNVYSYFRIGIII